eukprot:7999009-Ditylum_brightwellii.AAC.1
MNVLDLTWAFKVKWFPNGTINKLKACLCVCGDQQIEGVDVFDTYALVVNFSTIHLLLVISIGLEWASVQMDYAAAFVNTSVVVQPEAVTKKLLHHLSNNPYLPHLSAHTNSTRSM